MRTRARDAVLEAWDIAGATKRFDSVGWPNTSLTSRTEDRVEYLQRPDLGRALSIASEETLQELARHSAYEIVIAMTDGLSSKAVDNHLDGFLSTLMAKLKSASFSVAPLLLIPFARVGISDAIGEILRPKLIVILVGERPGLSSTDSLGVYLTYQPAAGRSDADRNCISNIRPPQGLSYEVAAEKLIYLINESMRLKFSGVDLKEDARPLLADVSPRPQL